MYSMSGPLSLCFCSQGHVSAVKTLDLVSQLGPCQVRCRVCILLVFPSLRWKDRWEGSVMSRASLFLMPGVCFCSVCSYSSDCPALLHCRGVVTSCRAFLGIVYQIRAAESEEIQEMQRGCWMWKGVHSCLASLI